MVAARSSRTAEPLEGGGAGDAQRPQDRLGEASPRVAAFRWSPPPGSIVHRSTRRVDPVWAAPRVALGHALVLLLVAGCLAWWPGLRWPEGEGVPSAMAYGDALAAPARVAFAFAWLLGLGATKRCFGAPRAAWAALGFGALAAEAAARFLASYPDLDPWALVAVAVAGVAAAEALARLSRPRRALSFAVPAHATWGAFAVFGWAFFRGGALVPDVALAASTAARATGAGVVTMGMAYVSVRRLPREATRQSAARAAS
ncbi:MAG: hypothetical protein AAF447_01235 [Myxococcota bacterium]